jgi:hypothetical protein
MMVVLLMVMVDMLSYACHKLLSAVVQFQDGKVAAFNFILSACAFIAFGTIMARKPGP